MKSRGGSVLILCVGLVTALIALAALFLVEVVNLRASGRHRLREVALSELLRQGESHAVAACVANYRAEIAAGLPSSRGRSADAVFQPRAGQAAPGWAGDDTLPIWASVLPHAEAADAITIAASHLGLVPHYDDNGDPAWSRWFTGPAYDADFKPTTTEAARFRSRYDCAVIDLAGCLRSRPDCGDAAVQAPAVRQHFGAHVHQQWGISLPQDPTTVTSGSLADGLVQYRHHYARSLASMIMSWPATAEDGRGGRPLVSDLQVTEQWVAGDRFDDVVTVDPQATWWPVDDPEIDDTHRPAQLQYNPALRYSRDIAAAAYPTRRDHRYERDLVRRIADCFHGIGLGRSDARDMPLYPAPDRLLAWAGPPFDYQQRLADPSGRPALLALRHLRPAIYGMASPIASPTMLRQTLGACLPEPAQRLAIERWSPFAAGLIGAEATPSATELAYEGVPWRINPLIAPPAVLREMILGFSPQLGYQSAALFRDDAVQWSETDADNDGRSERIATRINPSTRQQTWYPGGFTGHEDQLAVTGYAWATPRGVGSAAFELLTEPPRPDGSDHSAAGALRTQWSWHHDPWIFAALPPFFTPSAGESSAIIDPPARSENRQQLYRHLDGLDLPPGGHQALERFRNRLRYIRWLSWKYEYGISSPQVEQQLLELDASPTRVESLRYYRRPGRGDILADCGPLVARRVFAEGLVEAGAAGDPRLNQELLSQGLPVDGHQAIDGSHRYRLYPHLYPGPGWTGREGRAIPCAPAEATWTSPLDGRHYCGVGTAENLYAGHGPGARFDPAAPGNRAGGAIADGDGAGTPLFAGALDEEAADNYFWDVAIAAFQALGEARAAARQNPSTAPDILAIDERMMTLLGLRYHGFSENVYVESLFSPVAPVDVDGDGRYSYRYDEEEDLQPMLPDEDVVFRQAIDWNGDGVVDAADDPAVNVHDWNHDGVVNVADQDQTRELAAIVDPIGIYCVYNRFWPVADIRIPASEYRIYPTAYSPTGEADAAALAALRAQLEGGNSMVGLHPQAALLVDEVLEFFDPDDYHYSQRRAKLLASKLVNDVRMSLLGAGKPEALNVYLSHGSRRNVSWTETIAFRSVEVAAVGIAGRRRDPIDDLRPFSLTGRLVLEPSRRFRLLVRAQLFDTARPAGRDLCGEQLFESVWSLDPNDDGQTDDATRLYLRQSPGVISR